MILFDNISKRYAGGVFALDKITLTIETGEFVFLVGPSGAGKTTMLRLLFRELLPSHGALFLNEWNIGTLPNKLVPYLRRKIGFVFQDFKLLTERTVRENIAVSLEILGKKRRDIDLRVDDILGIVHLEKKGNLFPGQLSLGEQQRVAIGRAIAGEAEVLLADEPTGNLDPKTSWEIMKIINNIHKSGTTVVMATHNVDIVNSLKKRVVALSEGKITRDEKKSMYGNTKS
jgi:cell division transport system ATP-binding protein